MTAKERIDIFLKENNIKRNRFYGRCFATVKGNLIIGDIISKEEETQLFKSNGVRLTLNANSSAFEFKDGKFYEFSVHIPDSKAKGTIIILPDFHNNPPIETNVNSKSIIDSVKKTQLYKQQTTNFLDRNNIKENCFYGTYIISDSGHKILANIISKNEGNLLLRQDGNRLTITVSNSDYNFEVGKYYQFSIKVIHSGNGKEDFIGIDYSPESPIPIDFNPYKEITRLRYERLDNPEANRMIAHLMREIGKGLYSSKQRMIFELLQNADDTPTGNEVVFNIDSYNDYLLIMHNGIPFNQDDVEAITSAAESTKRNDKKKTGYKGIGFKSVFTDSEEVIIKSGGFLFTFKRNHPDYNNFDTFYFSKKRYSDYPKLLVEDRLKYVRQIRTFNGNTDVPWQLLPIWLGDLPRALNDSRLAKSIHNVGFAINFGSEKVKEYLDAVDYFVEKPFFMLFLRHVNLFRCYNSGLTIRKSGESIITINKTRFNEEDQKLVYCKYLVDTIQVDDESLAAEGINIYKKERVNEYGEVSHYFSSDEDGNKVIESIPPKLAAFENTSITFAAPISNGQIACEQSYLDGKLYSSFFTYLPMKEIRIQLPFLINADFVPSSNREELQGDNQWNEYVISKIAYYHLRWLKDIARKSIDIGKIEGEYLSLLIKDYLADDTSIQLLVDKYNSVYKSTLNELDFIITDKLTLAPASEIILDLTGISDFLGASFFYQTTGTSKYLPNSSINTKYLKYQYLEIEKFGLKNLIADLTIDKNRKLLSDELNNITDEKYFAFLKWLNDFCQLYLENAEWILALPIIRCTKGIFSIIDLMSQPNILIKTLKIKSIETLLGKIGFELTHFYLDDFKFIYEKIRHLDSYLSNDIKLYESITLNTELKLLDAIEKAQILSFLKGLDGVGETKYADTLELFKSKTSAELKPLSCLISNSCKFLPDWLSNFIIDDKEEIELPHAFKKHLIVQENILEKIFCNVVLFDQIKQDITEELLKSFYQYIINLHQKLPKEKKLIYTEIPWVYVPGLKSFQLSAVAYCPDSLIKLSKDKYESIKSVIESLSSEYLPEYHALSLIELFSLGCRTLSISTLVSKTTKLDLFDANNFLDWSGSNNEKDLLNIVAIEKVGDKFIISNSKQFNHYYSDNIELIEAVESDKALSNNLLLLPKELYSDDRHNLGLFENNRLLKYILLNSEVTVSFAKFVYPVKEEAIRRLFIDELQNIDLLSTRQYTKESVEHKIIDIIVELGDADEKFFDQIISKISVDGNGLHKKNISDDVIFKFPAKDNILERRYILKLSEILPSSYKDETAALTNVIENFVDFKNHNKLRKVFKSVQKPITDIFNEIHALKPLFFTPSQRFFLLLMQEDKPKLDVNKGIPDFDEYWFESDKKQYESFSTQFLNILFENKYHHFENYFVFYNSVLSDKFLDENYSIEEERVPDWLSKWLNDGEKDAKKSFLFGAGLNNENSSVVMLRKGLFGQDKDLFDKGLANTDSKSLLLNTAFWLLNFQELHKRLFTKTFLQALYLKFESKKIPVGDLPIPTLQDISSESYILIAQNENTYFHLVNNDWGEFALTVFKSIIASGSYVVDGVLPLNYQRSLKAISAKAIIEPDLEMLQKGSTLFSEPYYSGWKHKDSYKIFVFNGKELPYQLKYQSASLGNIYQDTPEKVNTSYFITIDDEAELPYPLKGLLPNNIYLELINAKAEFERKKNRDQYEVSYSDEESNALIRLFGDEIPKRFHKDLNLASLIKGLVYLANSGYDITEAEEELKATHEYSYLYPVYPNGAEKKVLNAIKVMCRSAKSGLLYLRASNWQELESNNTMLYVLTGNSNTDCRFCISREDIVRDENADYRVLRIEADKGVSDIDDIMQGRISPESLWLIVRMNDKKEYKYIFEKIRSAEANDTNDFTVNLGDESID